MDRATIGFPAYALRQIGKISRHACGRKPKLLCFPHSSAARVLVLKTKWAAEYHLKHYRSQGPCLYSLQTPESWFATAGFADPYHLTRQIKTGGKNEFDPPTAEQMAAIIATQPESCVHPYAQDLHIIGGYLYHRLPDELHVYDLQGRIIASGGITLTLPRHFMLTKPRRVYIRIPKIKRPPAPALKPKPRRPS